MENQNKESSISSSNVQISQEDLIKATRQITMGTSQTIRAGTSLLQEDIIVAANMSRKALSDLLYVCHNANKVYSNVNGNNETNQSIESNRILATGLSCVIFYKDLLECVLRACNNKNSGTNIDNNQYRQMLNSCGRNVAAAVTEIISVAESLKSSDWVDPEDPTDIAESELLSAADAIDSAAKKLARLKPRSKTEVNKNII